LLRAHGYVFHVSKGPGGRQTMDKLGAFRY
jgi:hypothetical protein